MVRLKFLSFVLNLTFISLVKYDATFGERMRITFGTRMSNLFRAETIPRITRVTGIQKIEANYVPQRIVLSIY